MRRLRPHARTELAEKCRRGVDREAGTEGADLSDEIAVVTPAVGSGVIVAAGGAGAVVSAGDGRRSEALLQP
jgi:hypothetical protein